MSNAMQITLRAGTRIYLNGAVVRAKSKVTLELLNDVNFLLESHVLQPEETTTSLRQLYFVLQAVLIDPVNAGASRNLFKSLLIATVNSFENEKVLSDLRTAEALVEDDKIFEALRLLRSLFAIEDEILAGLPADSSQAA